MYKKDTQIILSMCLSTIIMFLLFCYNIHNSTSCNIAVSILNIDIEFSVSCCSCNPCYSIVTAEILYKSPCLSCLIVYNHLICVTCFSSNAMLYGILLYMNCMSYCRSLLRHRSAGNCTFLFPETVLHTYARAETGYPQCCPPCRYGYLLRRYHWHGRNNGTTD